MMYVTKDNANLPLKRIMRSIFYKHPEIKCSFEAIHVSKFVDNPPGFDPSRRSRIGDVIYLLDSPALAEKLKPYPEDFKFQCGGGFHGDPERGNQGIPTKYSVYEGIFILRHAGIHCRSDEECKSGARR